MDMDKDLKFLTEMSDDDLDIFIKILTQDQDGSTRLTEGLTSLQVYKDNHPKHRVYIKEAVQEFQKFGGDTFANLVRGGKGVSYDEILNDVCKVLEVKTNKSDNILSRECELLKKFFKDTLETLSNQEVEEIARDLGADLTQTKDIAISKIIDLIFTHGSKIFLKSAAGAGAGIGVGVFVPQIFGRFGATSIGGPIAWAIGVGSCLSLLSAPASRVTIPATLYIAYLRQVYIQKKEEKEMEKNLSKLESMLKDGRISEEIKIHILKKIAEQKLNILIIGGTGVGKSSTINALFDQEKTKVGVGSTSETQDIQSYDFGNFIIYDSPGLGDSREKDELHISKITKKLQEKNENNEALIDLVLIIIDGRTRDYASLEKIVKVVKPLMEDKRILAVINKCDQVCNDPDAFDYKLNQPTEALLEKLDKRVKEVQSRIKEYGINADVIYYSAGFTKSNGTRQPSYNLSKLLYYLIKNTPSKKRFIYMLHQSKDESNFQSNEDKTDYNAKNQASAKESIWENIKEFFQESFEGLKNIGSAIVERIKPTIIGAIAEALEKKILPPKNDK